MEQQNGKKERRIGERRSLWLAQDIFVKFIKIALCRPSPPRLVCIIVRKLLNVKPLNANF